LKWVGGQYHTTGLAEVDGFVTDRFETPPGLAHLYRERLLVMPDSYVCYDPPRDAPDIAAPPVSRDAARAITFGSFNSLMKITPRVVDTWSAILRQLPGSRLFVKAPQCEEDAVCDALLADFVARGVAASRIDLEGESDHRGVLAAYGRVDIALQPFPYCGGVTLLEGLFMGVPSIAMTGESFASRHGVSHLSNVGLADCIAADTADYVTRALCLARSTARLAALRRALRERLASSPICDAAAFAGHFAGALRALHAACVGSP
jgi:predicted O-linked N-acetylglucosamine transferase (SPINDLY family)